MNIDIIQAVKNIFKEAEDPVVEGSPEAYDVVKAMDDKTLKKLYMGKNPAVVPREAQEELYLRFVQPHAHKTCNECYGRGHIGWIKQIHQLQPCPCLQRVIRTELTKENQATLYDPSGNKITFMN